MNTKQPVKMFYFNTQPIRIVFFIEQFGEEYFDLCSMGITQNDHGDECRFVFPRYPTDNEPLFDENGFPDIDYLMSEFSFHLGMRSFREWCALMGDCKPCFERAKMTQYNQYIVFENVEHPYDIESSLV